MNTKFREWLLIILIILTITSFIYLNNKVENLELSKEEHIVILNNFSENIEQIKPCVVMIIAETNRSKLPFTGGEYVQMQNKIFSQGTGFIVTENGFVLTANHIVKEANNKISVGFIQDDFIKFYDAKLINNNNDADIALLKIEGDKFPHVKLGDYKKFKEGTEIGFIGFPLNINFQVTNNGIISGKANIKYDKNSSLVQIYMLNAFVNQGNSGGPVFSADTGEVIGIINARINIISEDQFLKLPPNYTASMYLGGVDPIALSVETYNANLKIVGDLTQLGIGYSTSIEYGKDLLNSVR